MAGLLGTEDEPNSFEKGLLADFHEYVRRSGDGLSRGASALSGLLASGAEQGIDDMQSALSGYRVPQGSILTDAGYVMPEILAQGRYDSAAEREPDTMRALTLFGGAMTPARGAGIAAKAGAEGKAAVAAGNVVAQSSGMPRLSELRWEQLHPDLPPSPKVPVHLIEREGAQEFAITPDGRAALYVPPSWRVGGKSALEARMFRDIERFMNPMPEDTYFRMHHAPDDYKYLESGTHRGSTNWATGEPEGGLSVGFSPGDRNADYGYFVKGKWISTGSDGEPILDITTARPASPLMSRGDAYDEFNRMQREWARRNGFSDDELKALRISRNLTGPGPRGPLPGLLADLFKR